MVLVTTKIDPETHAEVIVGVDVLDRNGDPAKFDEETKLN